MSITDLNSILIVEPNQVLTSPYIYLPPSVPTKRTASLDHMLRALVKLEPDLVLLSASYKPIVLLRMLEAIKQKSRHKLIPVLMVVNLDCQWNSVIGSTWGGKMGICTTDSSAPELEAEIKRLLS